MAKKYELIDASTTLCALNLSTPILRVISQSYKRKKYITRSSQSINMISTSNHIYINWLHTKTEYI